jgi:hypothetical protein
MANLEAYVLWVLVAAVVLAAIAWLWLVIRAFQTGVLWGILVLLLPPLALIFVPTHWKPSRGPTALFLFACVVAAAGLVLGQFSVSRDPRVKMVEGEKHITLTHAIVDDYSFIGKHPDVVVLQMANEDVTDETLKHLEGLKDLRELDLNNTQITDEGLAVLAKLPKLRSLRLANTKITADGFQKHLAQLPELVELDLTGCKSISSKAKRDWKTAKKDKNPKLVD